VYPEPEGGNVGLPETFTAGHESFGHGDGQDDIAALRPYKDGDAPRIIAWKALARSPNDQLLSKQFDGGVSGEMRLDWAQTPGHLGSEGRISRLTRWVIEADKAGIKYGLFLPTQNIPADAGPAHRKACLTALALLEI
jgi:uncharacterized protein (DUF58 family)